jgi:peptidyl-prolyl cis-trans isomerase C
MVCIVALAGCSASGGPDTRPIQAALGGPAAETVNGLAVPQALLEAVARARGLDLARPEQRAQALNLVTDYVLLAQAAQQNAFYDDERFRADVEAARLQGLGNAALERLQQQAPITDAVVRAEYDAQVARAGKYEFDFSQLLFDNEADALKAENDIVGGKSFASVHDAWRSKAKQAKTFARVRQDQLPPELGKALAGMKNGETTKVPVKTSFGWHVVHLDISNPFVPPPFEQVKDAVRHGLLLAVGRERLHKLKEQAKIEYPPGATPPAKSEGDKADSEEDKALGAGQGKRN